MKEEKNVIRRKKDENTLKREVKMRKRKKG